MSMQPDDPRLKQAVPTTGHMWIPQGTQPHFPGPEGPNHLRSLIATAKPLPIEELLRWYPRGDIEAEARRQIGELDEDLAAVATGPTRPMAEIDAAVLALVDRRWRLGLYLPEAERRTRGDARKAASVALVTARALAGDVSDLRAWLAGQTVGAVGKATLKEVTGASDWHDLLTASARERFVALSREAEGYELRGSFGDKSGCWSAQSKACREAAERLKAESNERADRLLADLGQRAAAGDAEVLVDLIAAAPSEELTLRTRLAAALADDAEAFAQIVASWPQQGE